MPTINLRHANAFKDEQLDLDHDQHIIRNVSIIQKGPALGHGFEIDDVMLAQVAQKINAQPKGVKSRLTHPGLTECGGKDGIEVTLGRVKNAHVEGDKVRGDLHLGRFAAHSPQGDLRSYLMAIAEDDPDLVGLSIGFDPDQFEEQIVAEPRPESRETDDGNHVVRFGRVKDVIAADVVGDPAANTDGLLARLPEPIRTGITPELLEKWADDLKQLNTGASAATVTPPTPAKEPVMPTPKAPEPAAEPAVQLSTPTPADPPAVQPAADPEPAVDPVQLADEAAKKAATDAQTRITEIQQLAELSGLGNDWAMTMIADPTKTVADAKTAALEAKRNNGASIPHVTGGANLNLSSIGPAIVDAIVLRAGQVKVETPHERAGEFKALSIVDMCRHHLQALGVTNAFSLSRSAVVDLMGPRNFRRKHPQAFELAQSTSDFDNILADVQNKTLLTAYRDGPRSWDKFARRTTAPDFKNINRTSLSEAPTLVSRGEGGEVNYVTLSDGKETYALSEYTGGIKLTRKALINDDLDAFGRIPQLQANACTRKEDDVAYAIITDNANLDNTSRGLFNTTDANHTTSGTALSVASLAVGFNAMFVQKGPKSAAQLELVPKCLLVPSSKKAVADQLINSTVDPALSNSATNPYANSLVVIPSARLQANSATAWYLFADYRDGQIDTIEVAFLEDEPEPVLMQETDFDTDDMKFKVRHVVAAKAIDFRGVYKNDGA